jgi:Tol biopolymer transport system component
LAENVDWYAITGRADFDIASNGTVVYASDTRNSRLLVVDRGGSERVLDDKGLFLTLAISPDGHRAAVSVLARETGRSDLWIYDFDRGTRERFTSDPGTEVQPFWSPDGQRLVYTAGTGSLPRLVRRELSGGSAHNVFAEAKFQFGGSFAPDGRRIYYHQRDPRRGLDIYCVTLVPPGRPELMIGTEFNEQDPHASPDGQWLAFTADSTGGSEIYLRSLTTGEQIRISNSGGWLPRWRRDGRELFYVSAKGVVSAMPTTGVDWHHVATATLFPLHEEIEGFDVAPDGQSFLLSVWTPGSSDHLIHVITNALPH